MKDIIFTQIRKSDKVHTTHKFTINERALTKRKQKDGNYTVELMIEGKRVIFNDCYNIELV